MITIVRHSQAEMIGRIGTLWRVTSGGALWLNMLDDLPAGLVNFPKGDHRHRMLLVSPDQVGGYAPRSRRAARQAKQRKAGGR